jgi:hypothetical protein
LAILEGDLGLGKTLVTLDLCARMTTDRPCRDGSPGVGPTHVLHMRAEDSYEETIGPRLVAAGADMERVFVPAVAPGR